MNNEHLETARNIIENRLELFKQLSIAQAKKDGLWDPKEMMPKSYHYYAMELEINYFIEIIDYLMEINNKSTS